MGFLFSDLREIKSMLSIDILDQSEDKNLNFLNEQCGNFFEEITNRDFTYKTRIQYYKGRQSQRMLLRARPIFPVNNPYPSLPFQPLSVVYDKYGFYGSASGSFIPGNGTAEQLIYGTDYCLEIDEDNGSSRCGILYRIGALWIQPYFRQANFLTPFIGLDGGSYQVTYTAGFTVDSLPASVRTGANLFIAKINNVFPIGMELGSESYEDRAISYIADNRHYLTSLVMPFLNFHRNFKW